MPEMRFRVRWPNGSEEDCYSPSSVIEEHLDVGAEYALPEFLRRAELALELASERVRAKYGFACSSALDQLARLRASAARFAEPDRVRVLGIEKCPPREARRP